MYLTNNSSKCKQSYWRWKDDVAVGVLLPLYTYTLTIMWCVADETWFGVFDNEVAEWVVDKKCTNKQFTLSSTYRLYWDLDRVRLSLKAPDYTSIFITNSQHMIKPQLEKLYTSICTGKKPAVKKESTPAELMGCIISTRHLREL